MPVAAVRRGCHHHCTASEREFPFPDHPTKTIADASVAVWRPMFELFVGRRCVALAELAATLSCGPKAYRISPGKPSFGFRGWVTLRSR